MKKRIHNFLFATVSLLLLAFPIAFDKLYMLITEYSHLHYVITGRLLFLFSSCLILGVLLSLHTYSFMKSGLKICFPLILAVLFIIETAVGYFYFLYGGMISILIFGFVLVESILIRNK